MQIIPLPHGNIELGSYRSGILSALNSLDDQMGTDHTDHTDYLSEVCIVDCGREEGVRIGRGKSSAHETDQGPV